MTKPNTVTDEEWTFAEAMWQYTMDLAKERDPAGRLMKTLIEAQYPDRQRQIRFLGFMSDIDEELERIKPRGMTYNELVSMAKKWDVMEIVKEEIFWILFGPRI